MDNSNWFDEVLDEFVSTCPQSPKQNWGQNKQPETIMDKRSINSVPAVPAVSTKNDRVKKKTTGSSVSFVDFVSAVQHINESVETKKNIPNILLIQDFMASIGEPVEDWDLVLNKCRNDPEAMQKRCATFYPIRGVSFYDE